LMGTTPPRHQQETYHVIGCTVGQNCFEKH